MIMDQMRAQVAFFQNELRSFVLKRVKDKSLADDIIQDVFVKVHSRLHQLKDSEKIQRWIYQIARNTITDHYRKNNIVTAPEMQGAAGDDRALNECVANCVRQLLDSLPEKYRQALRLSEMEGVPQVELAKRLGISYSGVKSRVQRARRILREKMEESFNIRADVYGNILACESAQCDNCAA